jgi:low affinity Fe/Cu permease
VLEGIRHWLTKIGVLTAHPLAFAIVGLYGMLWFVWERDTFNWHGVATMATWFMTLVIQRAEHRDTQAIQAKVDELLHAQSEARNELTHIDEQEPEDIARHRQEARKND